MNFLNTSFLIAFLGCCIFLSHVSRAVQLYGINYGPRRTNSSCATANNIKQDLSIMSKYTTRLKTFHLRDPIGNCPHADRLLFNLHAFPAMELYLGLWVNNTDVSFENERK